MNSRCENPGTFLREIHATDPGPFLCQPQDRGPADAAAGSYDDGHLSRMTLLVHDGLLRAGYERDLAEARTIFELYGTKYVTRFAAPKPDDSPRPSEQATFELIPAAS